MALLRTTTAAFGERYMDSTTLLSLFDDNANRA